MVTFSAGCPILSRIVRKGGRSHSRPDVHRAHDRSPPSLYLPPPRFFPSIITLLNIRLIRVWYPGPLDRNQSTTSVSMRNEILSLRGRFQRGSASFASSASTNRSFSPDARKAPISTRLERESPGRLRSPTADC